MLCVNCHNTESLVIFSVKLQGMNKPIEGEERRHIEGEHDEAKESWVAGDQSIIAPVSLY